VTGYWRVRLEKQAVEVNDLHEGQGLICVGDSQSFSHINTPTFLKPSHSSHLPVYKDGTECSEMSAYKIQTPGNYVEESIRHSCLRYQYQMPLPISKNTLLQGIPVLTYVLYKYFLFFFSYSTRMIRCFLI